MKFKNKPSKASESDMARIEARSYKLSFVGDIVQQLSKLEKKMYVSALVVNCGCDRPEAEQIVNGQKTMEMHGGLWEKSEIGTAFAKANQYSGGKPYDLTEIHDPELGPEEFTLCYW